MELPGIWGNSLEKQGIYYLYFTLNFCLILSSSLSLAHTYAYIGRGITGQSWCVPCLQVYRRSYREERSKIYSILYFIHQQIGLICGKTNMYAIGGNLYETPVQGEIIINNYVLAHSDPNTSFLVTQ